MKRVFATDRGQVRHHNEDSVGIYRNLTGQPMAVVADGMGGHQAGDVASTLTTTMLQKAWAPTNEFTIPEETELWIDENIQHVNDAVYTKAASDPGYQGMGTTVVIAVCTNEFVTLGHIGDSRCYLLNSNGFVQMTEDHSLVNELMRSGEITKEEARTHPRKNVVLKALGTEAKIAADIKTISWEDGDKLLLCSDGLTDKVTEEELENWLSESNDIEQLAQEMISVANERGGEDNISLAIVTNDALKEEGEAS
ncbi:Protein-serine/threonine phosphatase [Lentibacillus sp. JNUCC-1]|uniref:Stp1/IreP family PP2C-type Ser/Thr phosphatase n=1 Tax=Lentibacillus sp. JNUCC-1 TaxID=2654513 RepID=UPI0012E84F6E|nr:Stp1/IreP family PP2C-type Ser/Thr phosphatase [Lentibacillus sp. JNUCC-1]MUV40016.1 Protein-serine/threonine phosphatase [Lentibacillus sp. JNUCC-1]